MPRYSSILGYSPSYYENEMFLPGEGKDCSAGNCDEPHHAKGLCTRHYQQMKDYGFTAVISRQVQIKRAPHEMPTKCIKCFGKIHVARYCKNCCEVIRTEGISALWPNQSSLIQKQ